MNYIVLLKGDVKPYSRTRKGKMENVKGFVRMVTPGMGLKPGDKVVDRDGLQGKILRVDPENMRNFIVWYKHDNDSWSVDAAYLKKVKKG